MRSQDSGGRNKKEGTGVEKNQRRRQWIVKTGWMLGTTVKVKDDWDFTPE